jgi:hypothetical protein
MTRRRRKRPFRIAAGMGYRLRLPRLSQKRPSTGQCGSGRSLLRRALTPSSFGYMLSSGKGWYIRKRLTRLLKGKARE